MTSGKPFNGFFRCPNCNTVVTVFGDKQECNICQTLPDKMKSNIPDTGDLKVVKGDNHPVKTPPTFSAGSNWSIDCRNSTELSNWNSGYGTQIPAIPKAIPSQVQSVRQGKSKYSSFSQPTSPTRELEQLHLEINELSAFSGAPVQESIRASGPSSVYSGTSSLDNEDTSSKKSWSPSENDEPFRSDSKKSCSGSETGSSMSRSMRKFRSPLSTDAHKRKEWSANDEKQHQESNPSSVPYGRNPGRFSYLRPSSADSGDICSVLSWTASENDDSADSRSSIYNTPLPNRLTEPEPYYQGYYDRGRERSGFPELRMEGNQEKFGSPVSSETLAKDRPFGEPIFPPIKGYCCKHCKPETCRPFGRFLPSPCCSNGMCKACSHCCCGDGMWYGSTSESFCYHRAHNYSRAEVALRPEQTLKRLCLPVCGAINFILCDKCFLILQVPANFLFVRNRNNKLMCGGCRKILSFSVSDGIHVVRADDQCGDYTPEDETGLRGRSSQREPALHRLMGYYSARDILREKPDGGSSRVRPWKQA